LSRLRIAAGCGIRADGLEIKYSIVARDRYSVKLPVE